MRRAALVDLQQWMNGPYRKPLILRGARQVGKSTLVKLFCEQENLELIEINLEKTTLKTVEKDDFDIHKLMDEIQLKYQKTIKENSLIFFDEIQESPKLLKFLRYFYEEIPNLKVIAAGSLLEIALRNEDFSFPVGRVEFYHLGPMNFQEFLWATGQDFLDQKLSNFEFNDEVHIAAVSALQDYYYVGGMPEVVKVYSETKSLLTMRDIQNQIIQTYKADFPKYNKRISTSRMERVFNSIALEVGKKVIYKKLDSQSTSRDIKRIVELLIESRVVLPCYHTDGNKVPLLGEIDSNIYKAYFLDIGLLNCMLNLDLDTIDFEFKNNFNIKGVIAEQYVAQHLNYFYGPKTEPKLQYHLRDKGTQKAEVDFLIQHEGKIYPLEIKSTSKGHLKSLIYFCTKRTSSTAFKVSLAKFKIDKNFADNAELISIPLYAIQYLKNNLPINT